MLQITPWERTALQLLARGKATEEIAGGFDTSEHEVEANLRSLFVRMGASSRSDAIERAERRGRLSADQ